MFGHSLLNIGQSSRIGSFILNETPSPTENSILLFDGNTQTFYYGSIGGGGGVVSISNVGTGAGVFKSLDMAGNASFKTLVGSSNIQINPSLNEIGFDLASTLSNINQINSTGALFLNEDVQLKQNLQFITLPATNNSAPWIIAMDNSGIIYKYDSSILVGITNLNNLGGGIGIFKNITGSTANLYDLLHNPFQFDVQTFTNYHQISLASIVNQLQTLNFNSGTNDLKIQSNGLDVIVCNFTTNKLSLPRLQFNIDNSPAYVVGLNASGELFQTNFPVSGGTVTSGNNLDSPQNVEIFKNVSPSTTMNFRTLNFWNLHFNIQPVTDHYDIFLQQFIQGLQGFNNNLALDTIIQQNGTEIIKIENITNRIYFSNLNANPDPIPPYYVGYDNATHQLYASVSHSFVNLGTGSNVLNNANPVFQFKSFKSLTPATLTINDSGSELQFSVPTPSSTNIYNSDGTITGTRNVNFNNQTVNFIGASQWNIPYFVPASVQQTPGQGDVCQMGFSNAGLARSLYYLSNTGSWKGFLTSRLDSAGNSILFYSASQTVNASYNFTVYMSSNTNLDTQTIAWDVNLYQSQLNPGTWFHVPTRRGATSTFGYYYQLQIRQSGLNVDLKLFKWKAPASSNFEAPYVYVIHHSSNTQISYSLPMSFNGADVPATTSMFERNKVQTFAGVGSVAGNPSIGSFVFTYSGYADFSFSYFQDCDTITSNTNFTISYIINGTTVLTRTHRSGGGGNQRFSIVVNEYKLNAESLLNSGILVLGNNTFSFSWSALVYEALNMAYDLTIYERR